jgi:RND superfamily putative drug exporter
MRTDCGLEASKMPFDTVRWVVSRHPGRVVLAWTVLAVAVGALSPNLTRLAAEGQAKLLPKEAESHRADEILREAWPEQSFQALAVVALKRAGGLTPTDHDYAAALARRFEGPNHPDTILRVLGPASPQEVAERLISRDKTTQLVVTHLSKAFVAPASEDTVRWMEAAAGEFTPPQGLEIHWTGDAVIGRDYMASVQTSLDRAAYVTVVLLLIVLLAVYRSIWLALVPLATIGVGLVISRGLLAWLTKLAGWEISPLVELFLVVILFGCGTDFCLFLSWRFGEHWNASNPGGAMRATMRRAIVALLTSAGTVIVGLCLMGTTRFKLFSSTGPSVALGLSLTLAACLTLTPALLILLARYRPRAFAGLTAPSTGFWDDVGHRVLARPVLTWVITVGLMAPIGYLGLRHEPIQDLFSELPSTTQSLRDLQLISREFGPGFVAPLTVVLEADRDWRESEGLALIDDVSRLVAHQRTSTEVRSATQPLGSPKLLARARLSSRLTELHEGFGKMAEGARQLANGLVQGAAKLRAAMLLQNLTGLPLTGTKPPETARPSEPLIPGLRQAGAAVFSLGSMAPSPKRPGTTAGAKPDLAKSKSADSKSADAKADDPRSSMLSELGLAAEGAAQIADGSIRARREISAILDDPVGRRALDRLLITSATVKSNPELLRAFSAYIADDASGAHFTRIDVTPSTRMFSPEALEQVTTLRRRLREYLGELDEEDGIRARALVGGANSGAADVRDLTWSDQVHSWIIVPLGVFLLLLISLKQLWACVNLVATMVLTYAFALGITYLVFVAGLGSAGIDWKVPYFLFVLLVAVGVDYNVFLMARLQEESKALGLRAGINRAIAQTGGLISSAAAITACSFASFLFSPLGSLRQLGFALVVGIITDAVLVRPVLVPIGQWILYRRHERRRDTLIAAQPALPQLAHVPD